MRTSLMNNAILHLLNFEKYSNFEQALREACVVNQFQACLLSTDFNPLVIVETRNNVTLEQLVSKYKAIGIGEADTYHFFDVNGVKTYLGSAEILGEKYYLLLTDNDNIYGEDEMARLADIIELAMGMWKYTPERDAKAEFIRALIRGNMDLAFSLKDEAEIKPDDILSVFCAIGYDKEISEKIINDFTKKKYFAVSTVSEDDRVYGFIYRTGNVENEELESQFLMELFNELKGENGIRIYHVTGVDGIEGAGDAFRMIAETISFVGNVFPYKRVFSKYELILVSSCIAIQLHGGRLLKNYTDVLAPFAKDKSNKSRQLLDTLETFVLDAGMNAAKTAVIMDVHTNTVQYRLKRINEILGIEITGNRVIPGLTVAIALNRLGNVKK